MPKINPANWRHKRTTKAGRTWECKISESRETHWGPIFIIAFFLLGHFLAESAGQRQWAESDSLKFMAVSLCWKTKIRVRLSIQLGLRAQDTRSRKDARGLSPNSPSKHLLDLKLHILPERGQKQGNKGKWLLKTKMISRVSTVSCPWKYKIWSSDLAVIP